MLLVIGLFSLGTGAQAKPTPDSICRHNIEQLRMFSGELEKAIRSHNYTYITAYTISVQHVVQLVEEEGNCPNASESLRRQLHDELARAKSLS